MHRHPRPNASLRASICVCWNDGKDPGGALCELFVLALVVMGFGNPL